MTAARRHTVAALTSLVLSLLWCHLALASQIAITKVSTGPGTESASAQSITVSFAGQEGAGPDDQGRISGPESGVSVGVVPAGIVCPASWPGDTGFPVTRDDSPQTDENAGAFTGSSTVLERGPGLWRACVWLRVTYLTYDPVLGESGTSQEVLVASSDFQIAAPPEPAPPALEPAWRRLAGRVAWTPYRPTFLTGMRLTGIRRNNYRGCGDTVVADYVGTDNPRYRLQWIEGKPQVCGDLGDVRQLGRPVVLGRRAWLYESSNFSGGLGLVFYTAKRKHRDRGPGIEIILQTNSPDRADLLKTARSARRVGN